MQAGTVKTGAVDGGAFLMPRLSTHTHGAGRRIARRDLDEHDSSGVLTNLAFNTLATGNGADAVVNFGAGELGRPAQSIGTTNFTVPWTGAVEGQGMQRELRVHNHRANEVRLWVNGQLLVDN